jgi:hypothetical protein
MVIQSITRDAETGDTAERSYYATGGVNYRSFLEIILKNSYCPIRGLSMGKTLQWYKKHL